VPVDNDLQAPATTRVLEGHVSSRSQALAAKSKSFAPILLPRSPAAGTRLLSIVEVAGALGVCTATVYKLCARRLLEHVRIINSIRVPPAALSAFVATSGCARVPAGTAPRGSLAGSRSAQSGERDQE
jgi:hypothetical protein